MEKLTWQQTLKGTQSQSAPINLHMTPVSLLGLHVINLQPKQQIMFSKTLPQQSGMTVYILKIQQHSPKHGTRSMMLTSPVFSGLSSPLIVVNTAVSQEYPAQRLLLQVFDSLESCSTRKNDVVLNKSEDPHKARVKCNTGCVFGQIKWLLSLPLQAGLFWFSCCRCPARQSESP